MLTDVLQVLVNSIATNKEREIQTLHLNVLLSVDSQWILLLHDFEMVILPLADRVC